jgi:hypothetical protein
MKQSELGAVDKLIEGLSEEPCILGMVTVVVVCLFFLAYAFREQRKMEQIRIQQFMMAAGWNQAVKPDAKKQGTKNKRGKK